MNSYFSIDVSLHFEVKDSEIYGGPGSIGYAACKWHNVKDITKIDDELIKKTVKDYAEMLQVTVDNIKVITKEEYDAMTNDDDDGDDPDYF